MPQMEVIAVDTFVSQLPPGDQWWVWNIGWEYVSTTCIPISSNGNVSITKQWVTSDPGSNRTLNVVLHNDTQDNLDCFWTLTLPAASVA
jgi:hypothetical protein